MEKQNESLFFFNLSLRLMNILQYIKYNGLKQSLSLSLTLQTPRSTITAGVLAPHMLSS